MEVRPITKLTIWTNFVVASATVAGQLDIVNLTMTTAADQARYRVVERDTGL